MIRLLCVFSALLLLTSDLSAATTETLTTASATAGGPHPATVAAPKGAKPGRFFNLHESFLRRGKEGPIGVLFLGDSITERWTSAPTVWNKYFGEWQPANFGIGGDRTQHVLWRIANGELDGISPKVLVLMIGTNNSNTDEPGPIVTGITKIVQEIRGKLPETRILLLAVFPREAKRDLPANRPMERVKEVNARIAKLDDGRMIRFMDINDKLLVDGKVHKDIMPDGVHLTEKGYEIWAQAIKPTLDEMMK